MSPPAVPLLVEVLCRHGLLEPDQLATLETTLRQYPEPKSFLKDLLKRNWLTRFQAQMLWAGRGYELVLGPYLLLDMLGEGGMGQVFKAKDRKRDRIVAIKRMRPEYLHNERVIKRFQREVRVVAQLAHPNIVQGYDAAEVNAKHLHVMEYVEGVDLAHLVKEQGPLPIATAVDCIRQTALGLQHVLERGLVHRDIKPSNLLLTRQGQIKILDLGLASFEHGSQPLATALTHQGTVLGSVDFIAPEQAADASRADIRADLYSLGCTFYYLLTGQVPFPGGEGVAKVLKHRLENPVPVELIRPEVSEAIVGILRTLMMKRPEDRYATPAELVAALAGDTSPDKTSPTPPDYPPPAGDGHFAHLEAGTPEPRRPRRLSLRWLATVVILAACIGVMAYFVGPLLLPAPAKK